MPCPLVFAPSCSALFPFPDPHPDLAVEDPIIDVLVKALLRVHVNAVTLHVLLDLGQHTGGLKPLCSPCSLPHWHQPSTPGTRVTLLLKASRSSMVRLSARAITGTTFTVRHSRCRNSTSRGRRLPRQGRAKGGSAHVCKRAGSPSLPQDALPSFSALPRVGGPVTSPVPSGWHEVNAAVYTRVRDVALAGDEQLLLQVPLVLRVDVAQDWVPAGVVEEPFPCNGALSRLPGGSTQSLHHQGDTEHNPATPAWRPQLTHL